MSTPVGRGPTFPEPADRALQPERTFLSWTRTSCSLVVVGLLGLRWSGLLGGAFMLVSVLGCGGMITVLAVTRLRARRLGHALRGPGRGTVPGAVAVVTLSAVVVLLAVAAAVVVSLA